MEFVESTVQGVFNVFADNAYVGSIIKVRREYVFNSNAPSLTAEKLRLIAEFMENKND